MTTRIQHYVWRHYLEAWQDQDGLVHCARNGEILPSTKPRNIMAERDFYKLPRITKVDADFLQALLGSTKSVELREVHRYLIKALAHISTASELIQRSERASAEEKRYAQGVVIEIEESYRGR